MKLVVNLAVIKRLLMKLVVNLMVIKINETC